MTRINGLGLRPPQHDAILGTLAEIFTPLPARIRMECDFCGAGACMGHTYADSGGLIPDRLLVGEVARVLRIDGSDPAGSVDRLVKRGYLPKHSTAGNPGGGERRVFTRLDVLRLVYWGNWRRTGPDDLTPPG